MKFGIITLGVAISLLWGTPCQAGTTLEDLKMDKRFGIGIEVGGPMAIMGIDIDVNVTEQFSLSAGLGTGMDYSTIGLKARYFLPGKTVSPYIGAGFAHWWSQGTNDTSPGPGILQRFLVGDDPRQGFSLFIVYPTFGVQFLHASGFEVSAEVEYLFKLFDMANGPYAGLGVHWYF